MILNGCLRYSAANLPSVGARIIYAPQGATIKGRGTVTTTGKASTRGRVWVIFLDDATGRERCVQPHSLFREFAL
jgi:hypothetical protein